MTGPSRGPCLTVPPLKSWGSKRMLPERLTTPRMTLRRPELSDLEGYVAYYTGNRTGGVGGPKPRYIVVERFMAMVGQWALRGYGRYVMTDCSGPGFGHVGVMQIDDHDVPEITWTLWDAAHEGQGFATEAAQAVLQAWQGPRLIARVAPDNLASRRVAERLGMAVDPTAPPASYTVDVISFSQLEVSA